MLSNIPCTFDTGFHGDPNTHPWISKLPFRQLGKTGLKLCTLSYGGSSLGGFYGDVDKQECIDTIQESIKCGINYLDTSPWYGNSEDIIGLALKEIPRNTYYIGTKAGRNFTPTWDGRFDFSSSGILKSFERSLERLGLEYVDIIQIHDVEFCLDINIILKETIPTLESIVRAGKAKYIGITGYDLKLMEEIVGKVEPGILSTILSYARFNFHDGSLLGSTGYFNKHGIGIINAAPLAMGLLTTKGPPSWHPADANTKEGAKSASDIAIKHGTTLEQLSLGCSLRPFNPYITTTLVSMPTREILYNNLNIVTTKPSSEDKELYKLMFKEFEIKKSCSWEGVEVCEYEDWVQQNAKK